MAIKPLRGLAPQWFTPSGEQDSDNPTRFKLKPLDGLTFLDVGSEGTIREDGAFVPNRRGREILLKNGLVGWENFDLKFSFNNFKQIPAETLADICNELMIISSLDGEDEKN